MVLAPIPPIWANGIQLNKWINLNTKQSSTQGKRVQDRRINESQNTHIQSFLDNNGGCNNVKENLAAAHRKTYLGP